MLNRCFSVFTIPFYVFPYNNYIINWKIKKFGLYNELIYPMEEERYYSEIQAQMLGSYGLILSRSIR